MTVYQQSVLIRSNAVTVERCLTDLELMHQWLNPVLQCYPMGDEWSTALGSQSRFVIQVPLIQPTLISTVVEREPGLIVWGFSGFFRGQDRWECQPEERGTCLVNTFDFQVPNPLVQFGFNRFASKWTQRDMRSQLQRFKQVAERLMVAQS